MSTILFVDDHHAFRTVFAEILRTAGDTVLEATTAAEVEHVLDRHAGPVDVLIVEAVLLTGSNGVEIARKIQPSHPGMRTLFVSAESAEALTREGLLPRGAYYLREPLEAEQLLEALRELASGQPGQEPSGAARKQKSSKTSTRGSQATKSHKRVKTRPAR